jgi:hypothetical protein
MFKILRKKIQSLSQTQQNIITVILILFNLAIIVFWINFWLGLKKIPPPKIVEKPKQVEEIATPFKKGEIGEPKEGEKPQTELPLVISNTSGTVKEIKKDRLIVLGDGSNFSDQKQRDLTLIFTDSTVTFEPGQKVRYEGFEGLKHLEIGDQISISSPENIRGKTEFVVNYINKL